MKRYLVCLLFLLLLTLNAAAQLVLNTLNGYAHIQNDISCIYKVVFTVSGNEIKGYSITVLEDGTELKANINGHINKQLHTLSFVESDMPVNSLVTPCLFDVKLTYKVEEGKYLFSGSFVGHNLDNKYCDEGTIEMEQAFNAFNAFNPFEPAKSKVAPVAVNRKTKPQQKITRQVVDSAISEPPTKETIKVTVADQKQFDWKSDTCILEIWDGMVIDGDIVTLLFNNKKVLENYTLVAAKKRLLIPLSGKTNILTVIAENEGKAPPNTSQILLTDGHTTYSVVVSLKQGQKGNIVIKKK